MSNIEQQFILKAQKNVMFGLQYSQLNLIEFKPADDAKKIVTFKSG